MKSENEIQLMKESIKRNVDDLWKRLHIHSALEEEIKLKVLKWVLDEPNGE